MNYSIECLETKAKRKYKIKLFQKKFIKNYFCIMLIEQTKVNLTQSKTNLCN